MAQELSNSLIEIQEIFLEIQELLREYRLKIFVTYQYETKHGDADLFQNEAMIHIQIKNLHYMCDDFLDQF